MLSVRGVGSLLDADEDEVLALVEEGRLLWAWNIALNPARGCKELRMLPACVAGNMRGEECRLDWRGVKELLVPPSGAVLLGTEVYRVLNCSGSHVYALAAAGALKLVTQCRPGPGGAGRICCRSWAEFLRARRWP